MKTREELNAIKAEYDAIQAKLSELSAEEMDMICGGGHYIHPPIQPSHPRLNGDEIGDINP